VVVSLTDGRFSPARSRLVKSLMWQVSRNRTREERRVVPERRIPTKITPQLRSIACFGVWWHGETPVSISQVGRLKHKPGESDGKFKSSRRSAASAGPLGLRIAPCVQTGRRMQYLRTTGGTFAYDRYSSRNVMAGSMRDARQAGRPAAHAATKVSKNTAPTSVRGSRGSRP
jgi:hypothetical protein